MRRTNVRVTRHDWRHDETEEITPSILVYQGKHFIRLDMESARSVVDRVHDLADEHDREQREGRLP